jgi:hypothetical protein
MTVSAAVAGFLPSTNGLHFANHWAPGPTVRLGFVDPRLVGVGDASAGLCGGMAWFVRERFEAGLPIPTEVVAPANGSPLFRVIVRRQVDSLDWLRGPWRFWRAAATAPTSLVARSLDADAPRIRSRIEGGRLALVGLVRHHGWNPFALDRDHTVLAYAYEHDPGNGQTTFRLYDPNWPDRDDVLITLTHAGLSQSTGEPLFGVIGLG